MALNDKFQLTNYGSEVQKAIDDALISIPQDLALKAYRDEVLVKNQTIPYTPLENYHPATKLYVDAENDATNQRLDEEIARSTAADNVLNNKNLLTYNNTEERYEYKTLLSLDNTTQALVDESAMDAKIAELSLGFFVYYQVNDITGELIEGRFNEGVNPYIVVDNDSELPTTGVSENDIALTLKDDISVNVYKYNSTWQLLNAPTISAGMLFSSVSDGKGYYWFANTWNLIDMEVDLTLYYTKVETDAILTEYLRNEYVGLLSSLTTTHKDTLVGAINEVDTLVKTKDTLPNIASGSVLANYTPNTAKPLQGLAFSSSNTPSTLAYRTNDGRLKIAVATEDDDATTKLQVENMITNMDLSAYQTIIPAGTSGNLITYSGTAGTVGSLTKALEINAYSTDNAIPTSLTVKTYVDNYAPLRVTQGDSTTVVTTNQITFWIEN